MFLALAKLFCFQFTSNHSLCSFFNRDQPNVMTNCWSPPVRKCIMGNVVHAPATWTYISQVPVCPKSHTAQLSTPRQTQNRNSESAGNRQVGGREILRSGSTEICGSKEKDFIPNWTSMDTELSQDIFGPICSHFVSSSGLNSL